MWAHGSKLFHRYLTDAGWLGRFGPTATEASKARSWLGGEGFRLGLAPTDRLYISACGAARQVERAFGARLGYYIVNGHRVRLASGTLTIPSSLAHVVGRRSIPAVVGLMRERGS